MRRILLLLILTLTMAAESATAKTPRDGWPDTPAGSLGRRWVRAFASGEAAMRALYGDVLSAASLEKRPMDVRIENYRKLRERHGSLTFVKVVKSNPHEVSVSLIDADAKRHEFVFTVEAKPPHRLANVGIRQRHGLHGGGGFHH